MSYNEAYSFAKDKHINHPDPIMFAEDAAKQQVSEDIEKDKIRLIMDAQVRNHEQWLQQQETKDFLFKINAMSVEHTIEAFQLSMNPSSSDILIRTKLIQAETLKQVITNAHTNTP